MSVEVFRCPNCGASVDVSVEKCLYCKSPVIIKTVTSVKDMSMPMLNKYVSSYNKSLQENGDSDVVNISIALCYMKLKLFSKALPFLEKAIELNFDDSSSYFYCAMCIIGNKKPFLHLRKDINEAEDYLKAAISVEDKGVFYFFWSYIRYDYYQRKSLFPNPTYDALLSMAKSKGVSKKDITDIFDVLDLQFPAEMLNK